jgi:hypothetical protein
MLHDLDLFYRIANPSRANIFARLPWPMRDGWWQITGTVRGPFTGRGHTLPSTARFDDFGQQGNEPIMDHAGCMFARATVIDPCTWSPDSPNLYEVMIELRKNDQVVEVEKRWLGLRDLRPQRRSLFLDSKRWVLRGVHADSWAAEPLAWWEAGAVRIMSSLDREWLVGASRGGAMTAIQFDVHSEFDIHGLRRIAQQASAAVVLLPNPVALPDDVRLFAPNLVLAQQATAELQPATWAHAAWVDAGDLTTFQTAAESIDIPIIAVRRGHFDSLAEARAAIDALQADLAPMGQFAGYVV